MDLTPSVFDAPPYAVSVAAPPTPDRLEPLWREVEARADGSPFLSWEWIGALLAGAAHPVLLARITRHERLVGLAILGKSGRGLHLNETGAPALDAIAIEYNDVLAERGHEARARAALLAEVTRNGTVLHLSGVGPDWRNEALRHGLTCRLQRHPQAVPLARLRHGCRPDPLDGLSRNTRQQIRRSIRFFESQGRLTLDRPQDVAQAQDWLRALEELHTLSWQARGKPGAFADPSFGRFHRDLIARGLNCGRVDLLRVSAGDTRLGYLYNLRWRDTVYAYQSGFDYGPDPRSRPGLVAHALAMSDYRDRGLETYNFLAGSSQYKESLSNGQDTLYWMTACRPGLRSGLKWLMDNPIGRARNRLSRLAGRTS